jgi:formyl-CoA transferase
LYAVIGALLGLLQRGAHGGEVVDEAIYSLMESLVPDYDAFGVVREPAGSALPGAAPSNTYRCTDGRYVVISGNGDAIFRRLMTAVGRPELAEDPRMADNAGRVRHSEKLDEALGSWAAGITMREAAEVLLAAEVPHGPILTAAELVDDPHYLVDDPHYVARGIVERHQVRIGESDDAEPREVSFAGIVPRLEGNPGRTRWLGPELGEHTDEVLAELGYRPGERAELRAHGVI